MEEPPGMVPGALYVQCRRSLALQVLADVLEDLADDGAEEDEGHDHDDRNERQQQTVLDERLTLLISLRGAGSRRQPGGSDLFARSESASPSTAAAPITTSFRGGRSRARAEHDSDDIQPLSFWNASAKLIRAS